MIDFTNVKIDTTDIFIFAGIILAAIGAIWGIRKMIYLGDDWYSERERSKYGSDEEYLDSLEYGGYYDEDDNFHKAE